MGGNQSTNTVIEHPSSKQEINRPKYLKNPFKYLYYQMCYFMTIKQYKDKNHLPTNFYYIKGETTDVDLYVKNEIIKLSQEMPLNKIPLPIIVMYAKKKIFQQTIMGECFDNILFNNNEISSCKYDKNVKEYYKISNKIKEYNEVEKIKQTNLAIYKDSNIYEIYIYFPSLTTSKKYIPNFHGIKSTNSYMQYFVRNDIVFNAMRNGFDVNSFVEDLKKINVSSDKINQLVNERLKIYIKENPLYNELQNICLTNGCISNYGEDFDELLPKRTKDASQQETEAEAKAPYYPTKCLNTINYEDNMFKLDANFYETIKKNISECTDRFINNHNYIKEANINQIDPNINNKSFVDELKKCYFNYRHNTITPDYNDGGRYHYSKIYNKNILTELATRNAGYPGIYEYVFPTFSINKDHPDLKDYLLELPWGNQIITKKYIIDKLYPNDFYYSFNNIYKLKFNNNGVLLVTDIYDNIIYILSKNKVNIPVEVNFENGNLVIYHKNERGDVVPAEYIKVINYSNKDAIRPFSMILDNNGDLCVYANKYIDVTDDDLKNRIKESRTLYTNNKFTKDISSKSINYDDIDINLNKNRYPDEYLYDISKLNL